MVLLFFHQIVFIEGKKRVLLDHDFAQDFLEDFVEQ